VVALVMAFVVALVMALVMALVVVDHSAVATVGCTGELLVLPGTEEAVKKVALIVAVQLRPVVVEVVAMEVVMEIAVACKVGR
jgi:hypothetical protein